MLASENTVSPVSRRKAPPRKLANKLVEAISESIRSCAIRPGDKLPTESEIVLEHGVSRTVVREAIARLQSAGLIDTHHGVGSFVRAAPDGLEFRIDPAAILTVRDVLAMLELRISLETETAALSAARRNDEHLSKMRLALDEFASNLLSSANTIEPDFQFHLQIAYSTGNRYFADVMSYLGTKTIPRTRVTPVPTTDGGIEAQYLGTVNREHEHIFDAILRRDPQGARAAMRAHLTSSRERLRRAHDHAESLTA